MNTNDFVKEYGFPLAETIINDAPSWGVSYFLGIDQYESSDFSESYDDCVSVVELKELIECRDLVDMFGGLKNARKEAHKDCFVFNQPLLKAVNLMSNFQKNA